MTPPLVLELQSFESWLNLGNVKIGSNLGTLPSGQIMLLWQNMYQNEALSIYTLWWSPHCWWHPIQVWSNPVLKLTIIMKDVNQGELQDRSMHSSPGNQCCMAIAKASSSYRYPWPKCKNFMEHQQLAKGHGVLPPNQLPRGQLPPDQLSTPTRSTPDPPDQFNSIQNY